jgi:hypothetical protein
MPNNRRGIGFTADLPMIPTVQISGTIGCSDCPNCGFLYVKAPVALLPWFLANGHR